MLSLTTATIRLAELRDADGLAEVEILSWRTAYQQQIPQESLAKMERARLTARWMMSALNCREPLARTWVLSIEPDRVIGYAQTGPCRDRDARPRTAELYTLYLHPDVWGHGQGARLLDHAAADLAKRYALRMSIWVLVSNRAAQRFYQREGCRHDGVKTWTVFNGARLRTMRYILDLT